MDKSAIMLLSKLLGSVPDSSGIAAAFGLGPASDTAFLAVIHLDGTKERLPVPINSLPWLRRLFPEDSIWFCRILDGSYKIGEYRFSIFRNAKVASDYAGQLWAEEWGVL